MVAQFFSFFLHVIPLRRSTIEVHPNFSEAPLLKSFITHPKTCFSKIQIGSNGPKYTTTSCFGTRLAFRRLWVYKEPCHSEKKNCGKVLPLSQNPSSIVERLIAHRSSIPNLCDLAHVPGCEPCNMHHLL